jgi:N4-gp56 family major capsid protein
MVMNLSTSVGLGKGPQTFYDRLLLERTVPILLHARWAQQRVIPPGTGKTIDFRRYSGLAVATTPLSEGTLYADLKLLTGTNVTATIAQYGDAMGFSDIVSTVELDPILTESTEVLGEQAGETLDVLTRDVMAGGTNVQIAANRINRAAITAADILTVAEIREAVLTLKLGRARKIGGLYHAIVHPRTSFDVQGTAEWVAANNENQTGRVFDGTLGRLYGVEFHETDNAKVWANEGAGSTVDVFGTMFLGANAYGTVKLAKNSLRTIYKALGSAGTADPLEQQQTHGWKATWTTVILNQLFMVRVEHATSTAANT